jgi:hypothetical protein
MSEVRKGNKFYCFDYLFEEAFKSSQDILDSATKDEFDPDTVYEITVTKVLKLDRAYTLTEKK